MRVGKTEAEAVIGKTVEFANLTQGVLDGSAEERSVVARPQTGVSV
jgi:hypothetical protein